MKTSITLGKKDGAWRAIILEGDGTREGDKRTVLPLEGKTTASEESLVAQLPEKYKRQLEAKQADLVVIR